VERALDHARHLHEPGRGKQNKTKQNNPKTKQKQTQNNL
jgi:hypothetical protein